MKVFRVISPFILVILLITGCRVNHKEWESEYLVPVAKGEVSILDLVPDTLRTVSADNSVSVVYKQELSRIDLSDFIRVPDTTIQLNVSLKTINLGTRELRRDITLGEVARNAGFVGQLILANQGKKLVIPPLNNLSSGDVNVDAQSFFESATFLNGNLRLEMYNGFPVEITDIHFQLANYTDKKIIIDDSIKSLLPGATFIKDYSLAGKTVEGKLIARMLNMNSPGSNNNPVLIDTNDAIKMHLTASNMQVYSARAIFPAQNLVDEKVNIGYNLNGAELVFMKIKSGVIRLTSSHTIQDSLHLFYSIPDAKLNGVPLTVNRTVPPAANKGDTSTFAEDMPVDGYEADLRGKNKDTFNTFYSVLTVHIDSTGKMEDLSLADSIYLKYGLYDVIPEYARGFLGKFDYESGKASTKIDLFQKVLKGEISVEDLIVNLEIENSIGAGGVVRIKSLSAINSHSGKSVALTGSVLNNDFIVPPASDNPLTPTFTTISLSKSNSNSPELMSVLPDQIDYELEVHLNNGTSKSYDQFIYNTSHVVANLNIELPMQVGLKGLQLNDTLDLNIDINQYKNVESANLNLTVENEFPIDAIIQVYMLSENGQITDSFLLQNPSVVAAGQVEATSKRVLQPTVTKLSAPFSADKWQRLMQTKKLVLTSTLNTKPVGGNFKIYSNYKLKLKLAADLKYRNGI